jgi:hypothetical protein
MSLSRKAIRTKKRVRKTDIKTYRVRHKGGVNANKNTKNLLKNTHYYEDIEDLYKAIETGNMELANKLLRKDGVNPNITLPSFPLSPLEYAIQRKQDEIAKLLIEKKAFMTGALEQALEHHPSMITYVIEKGAMPKKETIEQFVSGVMNTSDKEKEGFVSAMKNGWVCASPDAKDHPEYGPICQSKSKIEMDEIASKIGSQPVILEAPKNNKGLQTYRPVITIIENKLSPSFNATKNNKVNQASSNKTEAPSDTANSSILNPTKNNNKKEEVSDSPVLHSPIPNAPKNNKVNQPSVNSPNPNSPKNNKLNQAVPVLHSPIPNTPKNNKKENDDSTWTRLLNQRDLFHLRDMALAERVPSLDIVKDYMNYKWPDSGPTFKGTGSMMLTMTNKALIDFMTKLSCALPEYLDTCGRKKSDEIRKKYYGLPPLPLSTKEAIRDKPGMFSGLFNSKTKKVENATSGEVQALFDAIDKGDSDAVTAMLKKGLHPDVRQENNPLRPLEYAIKKKQLKIATLLIDKKADLSGALDMALTEDADLPFIEYLIDKKAIPYYERIESYFKKSDKEKELRNSDGKYKRSKKLDALMEVLQCQLNDRKTNEYTKKGAICNASNTRNTRKKINNAIKKATKTSWF